jgi:hypothetical protein
MKPTVEELFQEDVFKPIKVVPFEKLLPFLFENMKPDNKTMAFFYFFLLICVLAACMFLIQPGFTFTQIFWFGLAGFISSFTVLVPLHELFHAVAFRFFGARNLHFGKDLKQMMFYITVHNFVMNRKEFSVLAMMPFIGITVLLTILEFILPDKYVWFCISAIFWHATMCIGDFSMLAFYEKNKHLEMYTFDDAEKKISYFYQKV